MAVCNKTGCPAVAHWRGRCVEHAREKERTTNRAGRRIHHSKRWAILRDRYLLAHPLCECDDDCGGIATDVHHRRDIADGGDPWAWENLQALTHECHSKITRKGQATP